MWYHFTLTVPAGRLESNPVTKELKLTAGVIVWLGVGFPKGCKQLVKVRILEGSHQLFPTNPDEPAAWDGDIEGGLMYYELTEDENLLEAVGYSPGTAQGHDITIFINLLPKDVAYPTTQSTNILTKLAKLIGIG